jgi:hypothetical protein
MILSENNKEFNRNGYLFAAPFKTILDPLQAKSPHGGVMFSHSAHLMQLCCDFSSLDWFVWQN